MRTTIKSLLLITDFGKNGISSDDKFFRTN